MFQCSFHSETSLQKKINKENQNCLFRNKGYFISPSWLRNQLREGERSNSENGIEENCDFHGHRKQFSSLKFCILHQLLNHQYWNYLAQKLTLNFRTNLSSADEWSNSSLPKCCWLRLFLQTIIPLLNSGFKWVIHLSNQTGVEALRGLHRWQCWFEHRSLFITNI